MAKINYNSPYLNYANQTLLWLPMDNQDVYNENLRTNYDLLKKFNWVDANITYTFNSHGFRCDEFTSDPTIMFLGCSHTVGIGLPNNKTWPFLVSKQLGTKCANLGIGGSSTDTAFRLCYRWIQTIKPKIVVLLAPDEARMELHVHEKTPMMLGPWMLEKNQDAEPEIILYKTWLNSNSNTRLNFNKNNLAIEALCRKNNIKYLSVDTETFCTFLVDRARDLSHGGVRTNQNFSHYICSKL